MTALIRLALLLIVLFVGAALIAAHGVRGIIVLIGLAMLLTVPQTRVWQSVARWLVQLTGSRRRAAALAMAVVIGGMLAVNLYALVR